MKKLKQEPVSRKRRMPDLALRLLLHVCVFLLLCNGPKVCKGAVKIAGSQKICARRFSPHSQSYHGLLSNLPKSGLRLRGGGGLTSVQDPESLGSTHDLPTDSALAAADPRAQSSSAPAAAGQAPADQSTEEEVVGDGSWGEVRIIARLQLHRSSPRRHHAQNHSVCG